MFACLSPYLHDYCHLFVIPLRLVGFLLYEGCALSLVLASLADVACEWKSVALSLLESLLNISLVYFSPNSFFVFSASILFFCFFTSPCKNKLQISVCLSGLLPLHPLSIVKTVTSTVMLCKEACLTKHWSRVIQND